MLKAVGVVGLSLLPLVGACGSTVEPSSMLVPGGGPSSSAAGEAPTVRGGGAAGGGPSQAGGGGAGASSAGDANASGGASDGGAGPKEPVQGGHLVIIEPLPPRTVPKAASAPGIQLRARTYITSGDLRTGVLVGTSSHYYAGLASGPGVEGSAPFLWTEASGVVPLLASASLPDASHISATLLSKDGSTVVGVYSWGRAGPGGSGPVWIDSFAGFFRWTEQTGLTDLGVPENLLGVEIVSDAQVTHVSSDGRVIVGLAGSDADEYARAFRWTEDDGFELLGDEPGWPADGVISDMSDDGMVLVGVGLSESPQNTFRYSDATGIQLVSGVPGYDNCSPHGISDDGAVVIGQCYGQEFNDNVTFRWTEAEGTQVLESAPGSELLNFDIIAASDACDVLIGRILAADGTSVLGRWSSSAGLEALPPVPGQSQRAVATLFKASVSGDGSSAFGHYLPNEGPGWMDSSDPGAEGLSWSLERGMRRLGFLPGHDHSAALGADPKFRLHVGWSSFGTEHSAVLWDDAGVHDIAALLRASGVDLHGLDLPMAERVAASDESTVIQGGTVMDGGSRAFIAWLPPPG